MCLVGYASAFAHACACVCRPQWKDQTDNENVWSVRYANVCVRMFVPAYLLQSLGTHICFIILLKKKKKPAYLVCFRSELTFRNSAKKRSSPNFILQLLQVRIHDFNTFRPRKSSITRNTHIRRRCPLQESITAQHLSGMDWIGL